MLSSMYNMIILSLLNLGSEYFLCVSFNFFLVSPEGSQTNGKCLKNMIISET